MLVLTKESFKKQNFVVRDTLIKSNFFRISTAPSGQTQGIAHLKTPIPLIVGQEQTIKIFKPFTHDTLIKHCLAPNYEYTINFEQSGIFCTKKCGRPHLKKPLSPCPKNVRTRQTPFPLECGRPLWTAP